MNYIINHSVWKTVVDIKVEEYKVSRRKRELINIIKQKSMSPGWEKIMSYIDERLHL